MLIYECTTAAVGGIFLGNNAAWSLPVWYGGGMVASEGLTAHGTKWQDVALVKTLLLMFTHIYSWKTQIRKHKYQLYGFRGACLGWLYQPNTILGQFGSDGHDLDGGRAVSWQRDAQCGLAGYEVTKGIGKVVQVWTLWDCFFIQGTLTAHCSCWHSSLALRTFLVDAWNGKVGTSEIIRDLNGQEGLYKFL